MVLNNETIKNTSVWEKKGFELPQFDRKAVAEKTKNSPAWIHFGAGNIFRAFPAAQHQKLLNEGLSDTGIIVAESYDTELIEKAYRPFDNLSLLAVLKTNGNIEKKVIGSIVESLTADGIIEEDQKRLAEIFASPTLQIISFTITEKGYAYTGDNGIIAKVTDLLHERFLAGKYPVAMVSMDNCSHNGDKLLQAVDIVARRRFADGLVKKEFVDYINDNKIVSFPWTMIDKITPRPDEKVRAILQESGFENGDIFVTSKNTYASAFINAEEAQYLAIEDHFPNGRPPFEKAGIMMTDKDTVNKIEKMKVCTCLNPLHTALGVFGCLLSIPTIWETMKDSDLKRLVNKLGYDEG